VFIPKAYNHLDLLGAVDVALGTGAAAVFTNSNDLWSDLEEVQRLV